MNGYEREIFYFLISRIVIFVVLISLVAVAFIAIKNLKNDTVKCAEKVEKGEYKTMTNCLMLED